MLQARLLQLSKQLRSFKPKGNFILGSICNAASHGMRLFSCLGIARNVSQIRKLADMLQETTRPLTERKTGALYAAAIADTLAMPVHWYYNRAALERDYGYVEDFLAPQNPHPDSILWRSSFRPTSSDTNILHPPHAAAWGQKGTHYHGFLQAGDNTLNWQLAHLLAEQLSEHGEYDEARYLQAYRQLLVTPDTHNDTYLEECHRGYFENLGRGKAPNDCAVIEKHIGGLAMPLPLAIFYAEEPEKALSTGVSHLALTHAGEEMRQAMQLTVEILLATLSGRSLREVIDERFARQDSRFLQFPLKKWQTKPDGEVIGRHLSTACYIDESLPAVLYLAYKYAGDLEKALIVNTNLGGDNVHRGIVLGALLGAENGFSSIPTRWIDGLNTPPVIS